MTTAQLERRLIELERTVEHLKTQVKQGQGVRKPWWREGAGRFRDDPEFEEIARLGAEYRQSLRPEPDLGEGGSDRP